MFAFLGRPRLKIRSNDFSLEVKTIKTVIKSGTSRVQSITLDFMKNWVAQEMDLVKRKKLEGNAAEPVLVIPCSGWTLRATPPENGALKITERIATHRSIPLKLVWDFKR